MFQVEVEKKTVLSEVHNMQDSRVSLLSTKNFKLWNERQFPQTLVHTLHAPSQKKGDKIISWKQTI